MILHISVYGARYGGNEPFAETGQPVFRTGGADGRSKPGNMVGLPVPGGQLAEIGFEGIELFAETGMDHRTQLRDFTEDAAQLKVAPDRVFPVIGDRMVFLAFGSFITIFHQVTNDILPQVEML